MGLNVVLVEVHPSLINHHKGKVSTWVPEEEGKEESGHGSTRAVLTVNHWASVTSEEKGIWARVRLGLTAKGRHFNWTKHSK